MTDPLTPAERDIIRETTERGFQDKRDAFVEDIALFIETWGGVPPRFGGTRFQLAQDVRAHFGASATRVVPAAEMDRAKIDAADGFHERAG